MPSEFPSFSVVSVASCSPGAVQTTNVRARVSPTNAYKTRAKRWQQYRYQRINAVSRSVVIGWPCGLWCLSCLDVRLLQISHGLCKHEMRDARCEMRDTSTPEPDVRPTATTDSLMYGFYDGPKHLCPRQFRPQNANAEHRQLCHSPLLPLSNAKTSTRFSVRSTEYAENIRNECTTEYLDQCMHSR